MRKNIIAVFSPTADSICVRVTTSTSLTPVLRIAWSNATRCDFWTITSSFIPAVSGSRRIRAGSEPATQAAVASASAEAQPAVTRAAGQCNSSAIRAPTASRISSSRTY